MIKLLNRPLKIFTIYALLILICSIPVYYFIVDRIWLSELDEHNKTVSGQVKENLIAHSANDSDLAQNIRVWNDLQPGNNLREVDAIKPDSAYSALRKNKYIEDKEELDRLRGMVSYFTIKKKFYEITVESNVEETEETILAITIITIAFFLFLFVGFILLNKKLSATIYKPFYSTLEKIKHFELNQQQKVQFDATNILEFDQLNKSLDKLIENNITVYQQQKEFTENAAHELQTPLAIIQTKLDLLLQSSSLAADQLKVIDDMNAALQRIVRTNKNLLLLAKIENSQFLDIVDVDMNKAINETIELFSDHFIDRNISVTIDFDNLVIVPANKMLVDILLSNLLINAVRYNIEHGKLVINLAANKLIISNSGAVALQADKLFKRFSSQPSAQGGSGLGLSIVKQICDKYDWKLRYNFSGYLHEFIIQF